MHIAALKLIFKSYPVKTTLVVLASLLGSLTEGLALFLLFPLLRASLNSPNLDSSNNSSAHLLPEALTGLALEQVLIVYLMLLTLISIITWARVYLSSSIQASYILNSRREIIEGQLFSKAEFFTSNRSEKTLYSCGEKLSEASSFIFLLLDLLVSIVLIIGLLILSAIANPILTILAIIIALVNLFLLRKLVYKNHIIGVKLLAGNEMLLIHTKDLFSNYRRIWSSGRHQLVAKEANTLSKELSGLIRSAGRNQADLKAMASLFGGASLAAVCYLAISILGLNWTIAATCLLLIARVISRCSSAQQNFQFLNELAPAWQQTLDFKQEIAKHRVKEFSPAKPSSSAFESIKFENVEYESPDYGREKIGPFSLKIRPAELVLISGTTGVGKSTFCDIVSGVLKNTVGNISIDGNILESASALRGLVAYVPQTSSLISGSIRSNLEFFGPKLSEQKMQEALELVGLSHRIEDVDYLPGESGSKLSGGEKQRLVIAQALLMEKPVLIIDESTSGLDEILELEILSRIREKYPQISILLISHRSHLRSSVDRIIEFQ